MHNISRFRFGILNFASLYQLNVSPTDHVWHSKCTEETSNAEGRSLEEALLFAKA